MGRDVSATCGKPKETSTGTHRADEKDAMPVGTSAQKARYTFVMKSWFVYILRCADGTLYTGVTTDVARRLLEHNDSVLGAKYTRARRPVTLAYQESLPTRSEACIREAAIKKLSREEKEERVIRPGNRS